MSNARIAYVINSLEGGGAALPVPAIARVLRDQGGHVRAFALTSRNGLARAPMAEAGLEPQVRAGGEGDHLAAALWLRNQLTEWRATQVWTSLSRATILGLIVGPRLGLPVISWQHNAFLKPWNARLLRLLQSRATLWVADSRSVAELTASRLRVPAGRLATWPIYFADPRMPRARPWVVGEPLRLGSLGRLHSNKGYDVLIAALARLRSDGFNSPCAFEIVVAGEGNERDRLSALAAQAGLTCLRFAGYTSEPHEFLAGLHLYLQPSRSEGFCIAAHEALTAGLPVIGSSVGEMAHSIRPGENGWLVPPGQADALANAIREALSGPTSLAAFGRAARSLMLEQFSKEHFEVCGRAICERIGSGTSQNPAFLTD